MTKHLTEQQRHNLFEAWAYCDWQDKSTEYMLQYMQNSARVDLDTVLNFIDRESDNRKEWYDNNKNWTEKYER